MADKPKSGVLTGPQTVSLATAIVSGSGVLARDTGKLGTYADYRLLSKDPTISLGRGLLVAGILSGGWLVESDEGIPDDVVDMVKALVPLRELVMQNAVAFGRIDFGWQGFEQVFAINDAGRLVLDKLKPLLQDITTILVDINGNLMGYRQTDTRTGDAIDVPLEKVLHIAFEAGPGNLYGTPLLENVRATQTSWTTCDDGAKRYDEKIAGSHWIVKYPPGTSTIDGETIDNGELAARFLDALKASGSIAIPTTVAELVQELNSADAAKSYTWQVDLLSDDGDKQGSFIERLKYLDVLKIRGMALPERSMLEGQFGTKAEAGVHGDLATTTMVEIDKKITRDVNEQLVDQLLVLNYGPDAVGTVRLVAAPLADVKTEFLRKLYLELVPTDASTIDTEALKQELEIPLLDGKVADDAIQE